MKRNVKKLKTHLWNYCNNLKTEKLKLKSSLSLFLNCKLKQVNQLFSTDQLKMTQSILSSQPSSIQLQPTSDPKWTSSVSRKVSTSTEGGEFSWRSKKSTSSSESAAATSPSRNSSTNTAKKPLNSPSTTGCTAEASSSTTCNPRSTKCSKAESPTTTRHRKKNCGRSRRPRTCRRENRKLWIINSICRSIRMRRLSRSGLSRTRRMKKITRRKKKSNNNNTRSNMQMWNATTRRMDLTTDLLIMRLIIISND